MFQSPVEPHQTKGWIAVDLDGTLAEYHGWNGKFEPTVIGSPIPRMVERVLKWIKEKKRVKIFTARISYGDYEQIEQTRDAIQDWTWKHLGQRLEVTCIKDIHMIELWDDRCVQVVRNTGMTVFEVEEGKRAENKKPAGAGEGL